MGGAFAVRHGDLDVLISTGTSGLPVVWEEPKVAYHVGNVSAVDARYHVRMPAALACSFHR
jgi:hypothetical protein